MLEKTLKTRWVIGEEANEDLHCYRYEDFSLIKIGRWGFVYIGDRFGIGAWIIDAEDSSFSMEGGSNLKILRIKDFL